jgi:hypothetical protein
MGVTALSNYCGRGDAGTAAQDLFSDLACILSERRPRDRARPCPGYRRHRHGLDARSAARRSALRTLPLADVRSRSAGIDHHGSRLRQVAYSHILRILIAAKLGHTMRGTFPRPGSTRAASRSLNSKFTNDGSQPQPGVEFWNEFASGVTRTYPPPLPMFVKSTSQSSVRAARLSQTAAQWSMRAIRAVS